MKAPHLVRARPDPLHAAPDPQVVTLQGQRFDAGARVTLNGVPTGTVTARTPTTLTWATVLPAEGDYLIEVLNADGKSSNSLTLQVTPVAPIEPPIEPPVEPPTEPPIAPGVYGPQAIPRPEGCVDVPIGGDLQALTDAHPAGTVFWLVAGVHPVTRSTRPKSGNVYLGEYGAILDGAGWVTENLDEAAILGLNVDVTGVTVRNLVFRTMPQKAIECYGAAQYWILEHNEIAYGKTGIEFAPHTTIRYNYIHHNVGDSSDMEHPAQRGGGYIAAPGSYSLIESNEFAFNGMENKIAQDSQGVIFRNNWFHHNIGDAIWFDYNTVDAQALVEGNIVEDNGRNAIVMEATNGAIIRNNTVQRNVGTAIYLSVSQNVEAYDNVLEGNWIGLEFYVDLQSVGAIVSTIDLTNNVLRNNTVTVPSGTYGAVFTARGDGDLTPYLTNTKHNQCDLNEYRVPDDGWYWLWQDTTNWAGWQGTGQDPAGVMLPAAARVPLAGPPPWVLKRTVRARRLSRAGSR